MENPAKRKMGLMGMIAALIMGNEDHSNKQIYSGGFGRITGYNMNYSNIMKAKIKNKRRNKK